MGLVETEVRPTVQQTVDNSGPTSVDAQPTRKGKAVDSAAAHPEQNRQGSAPSIYSNAAAAATEATGEQGEASVRGALSTPVVKLLSIVYRSGKAKMLRVRSFYYEADLGILTFTAPTGSIRYSTNHVAQLRCEGHMARDININAVCAHCDELLDTNEAEAQDIDPGGDLTSGTDLHVGTEHFCLECGTCKNQDPPHAEGCSDYDYQSGNYEG